MKRTSSLLIYFVVLAILSLSPVIADVNLPEGNERGQIAYLDGTFYEAMVPDTLDLAKRAALSVNALTGAADDEHNYESFQCGHLDMQPPYMSRRCAGPCLPKPVHVLPMMRLMSGSTFNADVDRKMLNAILEEINEDDQGVFLIKVGKRPWRAETYLKTDQFWAIAHGRLMLALMTWYELDRNPEWLETVKKMAKGLMRITQQNEQRAWVPGPGPLPVLAAVAEDALTKNKSISNSQVKPAAAEPPAVSFDSQGVALRGLSRYAALTGDEEALKLAGKMARFMVKPSMWNPSSEGPSMIPAVEHARWEGHFHTRTTGVMGLLEYAIAADDNEIKRFLRDFYEYTRNFGIGRIGFFPAVVGPAEKIAGGNKAAFAGPGQVCEACCVGDMTWIAVCLSEEGVGDYWEDVDQYVRNHLVEDQMIDKKRIEAVIAAGPEKQVDPRLESDKNILDRNIGSFASCSDPTGLYAWWTMCCNSNTPQGMYKAWDAIVRDKGEGVIEINLLLNRASPWVDIDSYLPYEGKVVLKNKTAAKLCIRIPLWADKKTVSCAVTGNSMPLVWMGNYLFIDQLRSGDVVIIEFPMVESAEQYTLPTYGITYTCWFRGNTLIDISPRPQTPNWTRMGDDAGNTFTVNKQYPIYQRDFYKANKAPLKKNRRYSIAGRRLP